MDDAEIDAELDRNLAPRIVAAKMPRLATLDIERLPGRARVEHRGVVTEGDFWDLSGWKHVIGRRIHPDDVLEWPRTICAAWRWYGARRVDFTAEWHEGGREQMLRTMWGVYDQADIVQGHNLDNFDTKKLKAEWLLLGLRRPSPYKSVDTLKVARREFGFESNTLDSLTKRLGLTGKTGKYDVDMARRAVAGHAPSQRYMARYNRGDVVISEWAADRMRGWNSTHPHVGLYSGEEAACHACGGLEFDPADWAYTALTVYGGYACRNCGAPNRANHRKHAVRMRPAR